MQRQLSKQWPFPSSAATAPLSWVSGRVLCHSFVAPCHGKAECWPSHEPPTGWGITLSVLPHPVCESASLGRDEIMFKGRFRRKRLLGSCGAEGASANDTLPSFRSATQRALCISSSRDLHANRCQFIMGSRLGTLSPRIYHRVCGGWPWEERPQVANCCIFSPKGENPFKGVIKDCGITSFSLDSIRHLWPQCLQKGLTFLAHMARAPCWTPWIHYQCWLWLTNLQHGRACFFIYLWIHSSIYLVYVFIDVRTCTQIYAWVLFLRTPSTRSLLTQALLLAEDLAIFG